MDVAADFTMGIWVVAVQVATGGVGTAGSIGFSGEFVVADKGWVITLPCTFCSLVLWLSFSCLPSWVLRHFWLKNFYYGKECWCMVVIEIGVWGQACPPSLSMFSSSLLRKDRDRALCSRDCMI